MGRKVVFHYGKGRTLLPGQSRSLKMLFEKNNLNKHIQFKHAVQMFPGLPYNGPRVTLAMTVEFARAKRDQHAPIQRNHFSLDADNPETSSSGVH